MISPAHTNCVRKFNRLIPIGTSMDYESSESCELGCWNGPQATSALVAKSADFTPHDDFKSGSGYVDFLMEVGYGEKVTVDLIKKWAKSIQKVYSGDVGKKTNLHGCCLSGFPRQTICPSTSYSMPSALDAGIVSLYYSCSLCSSI